MSAQHYPRVLVTGAGGQFGGRVVRLLAQAGTATVVAGSRSPEKLGDLAAFGVERAHVDFDKPETLTAAFAGVDRLLIVSTDALIVPGERLRQHAAAVNAAAAAGVKHIVYTSMPNPEPGSPIPFATDHYETEIAIKKSGVPYAILRNSWYAENLTASLSQAIASGTWFSSAGDGRTSYVAREDTAATAAAVLVRPSLPSEVYDVTGPAALSVPDIAALATDVFGTPIRVVPVSSDEFAAGLAHAGVPDPFPALYAAFDANARAGRIEVVSDTVRTFTGREPQSLRNFLVANRDAFTGTSAHA